MEQTCIQIASFVDNLGCTDACADEGKKGLQKNTILERLGIGLT